MFLFALIAIPTGFCFAVHSTTECLGGVTEKWFNKIYWNYLSMIFLSRLGFRSTTHCMTLRQTDMPTGPEKENEAGPFGYSSGSNVLTSSMLTCFHVIAAKGERGAKRTR
jgi:hypothetical protein